MAKEFSRTDRVGAEIQRELAILVRDELKDPRLGLITIQAVRVVRDLTHAKVYFTVIGGTLDEAGSVKQLNSAGGYLRHLLSRRLALRTIPELHFRYDESIERGIRLSALIEDAVKTDDEHSAD